MNKKIIGTIILFSAVSLVAACSGKKPGSADPSSDPALTITPTDTPTPLPTDTPTPTPLPVIVTDADNQTTVTLSEYRGIKLKDVTDEEVNANISKTLSQYAVPTEVDRPAKIGDTVKIYFVGKVDGVPFDNGTYEEGEGYELVLGSHSFIDNFEDQLVGAKAGDFVLVEVNFPENYTAELAGKPATFDVTVKHVIEQVSPELTDAFVKEHFDKGTVTDYFASIKSKMVEESYNAQILDYLFTNFKIDNLSDEEIRSYSDNMYNYYYSNASAFASFVQADVSAVLYYYFGIPSLEYLRMLTDQTASDNVRLHHCAKAIAMNEGIEVTDEAFDLWLEKNMNEYGYSDKETFLAENEESGLRTEALIDLVYDFIIANASK